MVVAPMAVGKLTAMSHLDGQRKNLKESYVQNDMPFYILLLLLLLLGEVVKLLELWLVLIYRKTED